MVGGLKRLLMVAAAAVLLPQQTVPEVTPVQLEHDATLVGKTVRVVGRVDASGPELIFLKKCNVDFRGVDLPSLSKATNVALTGTLTRNKDRLVFQIDRADALPSDAEAFQQRYAREMNHHAALYELGRWAQQRGELYEDDEMIALARKAYERALAVEEDSLPEEADDAMLALAKRAADLAVSSSTVLRLKHHGYRLMLERIGSSDSPALRQLAGRIKADLDGTDTPTGAADGPLIERYFKAPVEVYRSATPPERSKLHRVLWCEAIDRALRAEWKQQSPDGFKLADEAERLVPERPLGTQLRRQTLERETAEIAKLSRRRVMTLAQQYRRLQQDDAGERLLLDWLRLQVEQLGPMDAERRVELADEYLHLGRHDGELSEHRRRAAQELLLQAWRLTESPEVAEHLKKLDMVFVEDAKRWLTRREYEQTEQAEAERQIRLGQIAPGMTGEQVLQARSGPPDAVVRFGTHERLEEQWIYETGENQRYYVNLLYSQSAQQWVVESLHGDP